LKPSGHRSTAWRGWLRWLRMPFRSAHCHSLLPVVCHQRTHSLIWGELQFLSGSWDGNWAVLPTLLAELVPGFDLFPTWSAAVFYVTRQRVRPAEPEILH